MKKNNEPIDTLCRRVLRRHPVEARGWLIAHPECPGHAALTERLKLIIESGALAVHVGELATDDDGIERLEQVIVSLPPTDNKIKRVVAVIVKTQPPGAEEPEVGMHFATVDCPLAPVEGA